jgi:hypothetical protein
MNSVSIEKFNAAVLGLALPAAALEALQCASAARGDAVAEMAALMRAQSAAPEHPAVLIAFYRCHFYGHRLRSARDVARRALVVGARALGLPEVWREVPRRALAGARQDAGTRFFLFALKGLAYLSLRLGDTTEAAEALALLRVLDPEDGVGAALLEDVRQRAARRALAGVDDDDDIDAGQAWGPRFTGAAAWAALAPMPAPTPSR